MGGMVTNDFFSRDITLAEKLRQRFDAGLRGIKEEFDDHLQSINDNTNEIQANYEYAARIDEKLGKLLVRINQLEATMTRLTGQTVIEETNGSITLNETEKKIFLILYTASDEKPVTYEQIAQYLNENDFLVRGYITNMLEKGIPIQKQHVQKQVLLSLSKNFKDKQAKSNLLEISQRTVKEFLR